MKQKDMFAGGRKPTFQMAASLRRHQTNAELILWDYLKIKPLGIKFRRQHVYGIWVLDFYCHSLQLGIGVDGSIHNIDAVKKTDKKRQNEIENIGLKFPRFTNHEIQTNLAEIIKTIENFIRKNTQPNQMTQQPKSPL